MSDEKSQRIAWQLAIAGFVPFGVLAVLAFYLGQTHPLFSLLIEGLRSYGAVILSFLGGIRWGLALNDNEQAGRFFALAVVPAIIGWLALFAPDIAGLIVLIAAFGAQGAWDSFSFHADPKRLWFARLRIAITCLVAVSLVVALLAFR